LGAGGSTPRAVLKRRGKHQRNGKKKSRKGKGRRNLLCGLDEGEIQGEDYYKVRCDTREERV